jgi:hypothetical protein
MRTLVSDHAAQLVLLAAQLQLLGIRNAGLNFLSSPGLLVVLEAKKREVDEPR